MGHMSIKTDRLNVRIGPRLREDLEQHARYQEMTLGEFVRYALVQYLETQEDPTDESDQQAV